MMIFLKEVTHSGTGAVAAALNHPLGGKTGTTSDFTDAWFLGFSPSVTCGVWMGYDNRQSLGEKETGAKAALPIWMDFMKVAIADKPDETFPTDTKHPPAPTGKADRHCCEARAETGIQGWLAFATRTAVIYSERSAINGSTLAARRAGITLAATATAATPIAAKT